MGQATHRHMTQHEFLGWLPSQAQRHELVGGVPVAMAGAKRRHDQIVVNALRDLGNQLRRGRCRPFSAGTALLIPAGNVRFPDVGVECGTFHAEATHADAPSLVIEVLSASTRDFDLFGKLEEYKTVPDMRDIVLLDPDEPRAIHWTRPDGGAWSYRAIDGLDADIGIETPPIVLRLAELYEGLAFRPKPRLVGDG